MTFKATIQKILILIAVLSILPLSGCTTLNSQTLDLHPEIQVSRQFSKEKRFDIQPKDLRVNKVIGLRHTGKDPQPEIVLQDSLKLLSHTAEHALEDMGIRRFYAGEFTLKVSLLDLNYKVKKSGLKQTIDLDMKMRVELSKGVKSYTGNYATTKQHVFLNTPSEQDNEEIIGKLVSETMNRAFNDPQLLDFIQFN
ncbi:YajG family lipoprotein [Neptuniibacter sp.]|uniref:YajG family lipoprotein n=1 Tax=Neptuniibacter sp. TaxID=1962643 RepID=UPI00262DAF28|nr:YajG family lipoprotein [Neptuniibacter sp.]MCP4598536.1 hypothetical protein [Neptuniibacter sp.]